LYDFKKIIYPGLPLVDPDNPSFLPLFLSLHRDKTSYKTFAFYNPVIRIIDIRDPEKQGK